MPITVEIPSIKESYGVVDMGGWRVNGSPIRDSAEPIDRTVEENKLVCCRAIVHMIIRAEHDEQVVEPVPVDISCTEILIELQVQS